MSEKDNQPAVVSGKKFAVMVVVMILWLAYLAFVAVMRKMGC
jgi:hypothetical protein